MALSHFRHARRWFRSSFSYGGRMKGEEGDRKMGERQKFGIKEELNTEIK
jgi:hypothetical protein